MDPNAFNLYNWSSGDWRMESVAGKFIFAKNTQRQVDEAESQAKKLLADAQTNAETVKQQKQLEAKEKFLQLKSVRTRQRGAEQATGN